MTVTTPSKHRKTAETARPKRTPAAKPAATPRRHPAKAATSTGKVTTLSPDGKGPSAAKRETSRQVEQLAVLALAFICGLVGFAVHFFWFAAVLLMAVLLGLAAAELRAGRRRGLISEVAAEAKNVAADLTSTEEPEPSLDGS